MEKHIHKYVRIKIGKNKRIEFKCSIPACPHHLRYELIEGRESICNRCGGPFIMTKTSMQLSKPHCDDCTNTKKTKLNKIRELMDAMEIK
jgi:hypothetical protein